MNTRFLYALMGGAVFSAAVYAQAPAKPAAAAAPATKETVLTATSANVKESGIPVKIRIFRWSNDEERAPLVAALTAPPPGAGRAAGGGGRPGGGGGRPGGAAAGRGAAPADAAAADAAPDPAAVGGDAAPTDAQAGRAARGGGGGRGGRGGRGDAAPLTPIQQFTAALQKAPTVGYIWTTDVTGYSIKYAWHTTQPDGTERVILATDRRLGAYSPAWELKAAGGAPTEYEFTLLELRLDAKGGEGKASLTTKLIADNDTKQLGLENYAAAPAILQNVKRSSN